MKRLAFRIAVALMCTGVLVAVPFAEVLAQGTAGGVDAKKANVRANRNAAKAPKGQAAKENPFPNATRKDPPTKVAAKLGKKLDKAVAELYDEKYDAAEKGFNEVLADAKAGNYEKALAYQGLATVANERDDDPIKTIDFTKRALDLDALPNVTHFGALLQYANLNLIEEKYDIAIASIDQWLKLTGSEKDTAYSIKAQALYQLDRFDESAAAIKKAIALTAKPSEGWYQLLIASYAENEKFPEAIAEGEAALKAMPESKVLTRTLANAYIQAEQADKAVTLLSAAYQKGMLSTESDIKQVYQLYNYGERPLEAIKVIEDGLAKKILPRNLEHLRALGESNRLADRPVEAAKAFGEAAQFATDGEMAFLQGYTLYEAEKLPEAKVAVQAALKRTPFKSEGQAWILLGNCELEAGNKEAAVAAYKKALGFEATRKSAENWLKNAARM